MNGENLDELVKFSEEHPWKPRYPSELVRRFLTELISNEKLVFDLYDEQGRVATAVLLDKVQNPANDACLEILGLRSAGDASAALSKFIALARGRTPTHRSGFQVGLPHESPLCELVMKLGLRYYYATYTMQRENLSGLVDELRTEIVDAKPDDRARLYDVLCKSFAHNPDTSIPDAETWTQGFMKSSKEHYYLWQTEGEILGFAALIEGVDGQETEVRNVGVLPAARGTGIGQHLLTHCLRKSKDLGYTRCHLTVAVENQQALNLYLRLGFKITEQFACYRMALR